MLDKLEEVEKRYEELNKLISDPAVIADQNAFKKYMKEQSGLTEVVEKYREYKKIKQNMDEAEEMMSDPEMKEMAAEELINLEPEKENLYKELEILLVPKDENDGKNVIMEIRGAAGGDEANIFSGDLFRMYSYYAEKNGWKIEVIHTVEGTSGGYSYLECLIKGDNVYSKLKYESGSHRVQRVPETESQGRVHTSTATVAVMPEVEDVNIEINENDLKIDVYHSSGAGGQSVNTSNSAVRITHVPTGVVVTCQTERSQLRNKERAMALLKSKINNEIQERQANSSQQERKSKIGTGDRSEKIRTYNYPQNRVTDHRINFSLMELDRVMDGGLEPIITALINEDMRLKLAGVKSEQL